jgi:hypothetical protein
MKMKAAASPKIFRAPEYYQLYLALFSWAVDILLIYSRNSEGRQ